MNEDQQDFLDIFDPVDDDPLAPVIFSISSYGADYPAEIIASRIKEEDWYTPPFQRNFVWTLSQASRFIESLLLGLPVPGIFLFKESETGKQLIIDGQQRTKSIQIFMHEKELRGKLFRLSGVAPQFEGKLFSELEDEDRRRIKDSIVHATVFSQLDPSDGNRSVYEVFERINTGGSKLSAQEIRSCVNHGPIVELLERLSQTNEWRRIFKSSSNRLKDHELILRFAAFYFASDTYVRPMKSFLNDYMSSVRDHTDAYVKSLTDAFVGAMGVIGTELGDKAFRPDRSFNAAVFDSVSVTVAAGLRDGSLVSRVQHAYSDLLSNKEFLELTSQSTANEERVKKRFEIARSYLIES